METELALANGTRGISSLQFDPSGEKLLVSSWDAAISLYDVHSGQPCATHHPHSAPVLDSCFVVGGGGSATSAASAGADGAVKLLDLATGVETSLAVHGQPASCVEHCVERGAVVSAGWDKQLMLSDPRQPPTPVGSPANTFNCTASLPDKAYALGVCPGGNRLVVGMAARHVYVYDVRKLSEPEQRRESSLKYQTRCISCMPGPRAPTPARPPIPFLPSPSDLRPTLADEAPVVRVSAHAVR
jgi:cell cycle arrest protein BUB3